MNKYRLEGEKQICVLGTVRFHRGEVLQHDKNNRFMKDP